MDNREQDLHAAVRKGDKSQVQKLLSVGTNINCLFYGWTPLQLAVDIGHQDMAVFLINADSNFEFHESSSKAVFEEAVMKKQLQVIDALLKRGVTGDIIMTNGETPLTHAAKLASLDVVTALVQGGVNVNSCNSYGNTALYLAAKTGESEVVKTLIAAGADVNFTCSHEGTPLIAAVANEHKSVVCLLTKQPGCELNAQDSDGWTALWHAYSCSRDDICSVLLRAGADKSIPNQDGRSVVQDAQDNEDEIMLEIFKKYSMLPELQV